MKSEPTSSADAAAPRREPWAQLKFFTFQPHIFRRMLGKVSKGARPGDLVSVYDKAGNLCGGGLYNPHAKIPLRVVCYRTEPVSEDYFEEAVERAVRWRLDRLGLARITDAYRLINSDGDGISGLTVDRFGPVLVIEVFSLGILQRMDRLLPLLHRLAGTRHHVFALDPEIARVERMDATMVAALGEGPGGPAPQRVKIREHGITFEVDFAQGHKTGFFCDQRENRRRLAGLVRDGERVLDLCTYSGGFALAAAYAAGRVDVTGVDLDEDAIAMARRNANLNRVRARWVHADAFSYARQMQTNGEQWDIVVLDPPKFVLTREPAGAAEGHRKYEDLNQLAISLVKPGGLFVTCSCSGLVSRERFEAMVIKAAHREGRRLQIFDTTGPGADHPVYSNCLESRYLKVIWARVV